MTCKSLTLRSQRRNLTLMESVTLQLRLTFQATNALSTLEAASFNQVHRTASTGGKTPFLYTSRVFSRRDQPRQHFLSRQKSWAQPTSCSMRSCKVFSRMYIRPKTSKTSVSIEQALQMETKLAFISLRFSLRQWYTRTNTSKLLPPIRSWLHQMQTSALEFQTLQKICLASSRTPVFMSFLLQWIQPRQNGILVPK